MAFPRDASLYSFFCKWLARLRRELNMGRVNFEDVLSLQFFTPLSTARAPCSSRGVTELLRSEIRKLTNH